MGNSSRAWLKRQAKDLYVQAAKKDGYRSRAAYKLQEMNDKYNFFKQGMFILELGAAPGSWSQFIAQQINADDRIIAVDILPISPIPGVITHQADITSDEFHQWLKQTLPNQKLDWVLSDMAPEMSGHRDTDQLQSINLCEEAFVIATQTLRPNTGCMLVKTFQGIGFTEYLAMVKQQFHKVKLIKPKASQRSAREVYLLAEHFKDLPID